MILRSFRPATPLLIASTILGAAALISAGCTSDPVAPGSNNLPSVGSEFIYRVTLHDSAGVPDPNYADTIRFVVTEVTPSVGEIRETMTMRNPEDGTRVTLGRRADGDIVYIDTDSAAMSPRLNESELLLPFFSEEDYTVTTHDTTYDNGQRIVTAGVVYFRGRETLRIHGEDLETRKVAVIAHTASTGASEYEFTSTGTYYWAESIPMLVRFDGRTARPGSVGESRTTLISWTR